MKTLKAIFLLSLFVCGCTGSSTSVSGLVTIDGKPAPTGSISLQLVGGGPVHGSPIEEGRYRISKLEPGTYRATIMAFAEAQFAESSAELETAAAGPAAPQMLRDLAQGAEGNGVEVEVTAGSQAIDFPLKSRG